MESVRYNVCTFCQQTKLRLEMNMEKMKKQHSSELEEKEEELEDMRIKMQKKVPAKPLSDNIMMESSYPPSPYPTRGMSFVTCSLAWKREEREVSTPVIGGGVL